MPRPPDPAAIAALLPYVTGDAHPPSPSGLLWDAQIAQRNTPEAVLLQLQGWEPWQADAMPREEEGRPVLDQILHFRKLVPEQVILERARAWVALDASLEQAEAEREP